MALFGGRQKQLDVLEREVLSNPTPQGMVTLVERYVAAGDEERALEIARRAVDRFPDNEKCQAAFENVRKLQLQLEIQELNRSIRANPSKRDYERLADIYHHELGNRTKAFETALEGLVKFPSSDGLHSISGNIRMDRFHQDFLANDFTEAMKHFEQAVSLNPGNYRALIGVGRLYAEACVFRQARAPLGQALQANPDDETAGRLMQAIDKWAAAAAPNLEDALAEIEARHALSQAGAEIRKIFEPVASSGGGEAPQVDSSKVEQFMSGFESMSGYKCAAVLTEDGSCLAAHSRGLVSKENFTRLIRDISQCCMEASRRMDIGVFTDGEIETSVGRMALAEGKGFIVGILAAPPAKKADLQGAVDKVISFLMVK